jgi:branched-chain amino acid transport system substrate-binding protein
MHHCRALRRAPQLALYGLLVVGLMACTGTAPGAPTSGGGAASQPGGEVNIGVLTSVTGAYAALGQGELGGIKVAVDDINTGGGFVVGGAHYTINMISADAGSDPAKANTAATQLLRDQGVKFLLGPTEVLSANAVQPQVSAAKVLWITNTSTYYDELATPDPKFQYYFSNLPGTGASGDALITGALHFVPSAKSAALVIPDPASNDVVANTYRDLLRSHGLDLPDDQIYRVPADTSDFTPLLTRIKARHPDFLMAGSATTAAASIARQWSDLGDVAGAYLAISGTLDLGRTSAAGDKPVPFTFLQNNYGDTNPLDVPKPFADYLARYASINGGPPPAAVSSSVTAGYVSPLVLLTMAMQRAGTVTDVDAISKALTQVTTNGPLGSFGYNNLHQGKMPMTTCMLNSGDAQCFTVPYSGAE